LKTNQIDELNLDTRKSLNSNRTYIKNTFTKQNLIENPSFYILDISFLFIQDGQSIFVSKLGFKIFMWGSWINYIFYLRRYGRKLLRKNEQFLIIHNN
jgi:hypothetical protein